MNTSLMLTMIQRLVQMIMLGPDDYHTDTDTLLGRQNEADHHEYYRQPHSSSLSATGDNGTGGTRWRASQCSFGAIWGHKD